MDRIGKVTSVTYEKLIFEVSDYSKLNFNYNGKTYISEGVNEYVTILSDFNERYIYQIIKIEEKEIMLTQNENSKIEYTAKFEAVPVGIIINDILDFNIRKYPHLNCSVYLTTELEFKIIFNEMKSDSKKTLLLGQAKNFYNISIEVNRLFSHHTAVLGNTGSGKSTTIRKLLTEINKLNSSNLNIFVFDVHQEYRLTFAKNINVESEYKIDPETLTLQDWINLVKPAELVQLPLLQDALKISCILHSEKIEIEALNCFLALEFYFNIQTDAVAKRSKILGLLNDTSIDTSKYSQYGNFAGKYEDDFINALKASSKIENETLTKQKLNEIILNVDYKAFSFENLKAGLEYAFLLEESKGNNSVRSHCNSLSVRINSLHSRFADFFVHDTALEKNEGITVFDVSSLDTDLLTFITSYILKTKFEENKILAVSERSINIFIFEEAHKYISKNLEYSE